MKKEKEHEGKKAEGMGKKHHMGKAHEGMKKEKHEKSGMKK